MRLFIVSLLAALSTANAYAVGYPHHAELLAYTPAHGESRSAVGHGYIHYIDENGLENLLGYDYPDPLYILRSLSPIRANAPSNAYLPTNDQFTAAEKKAREEHFFVWTEKRYQALKTEIERLNSIGKQPSPDMLAQFRCLRKIVKSTNFTFDFQQPQLKRLTDEHLRIWHEARLRVSQWEAERLSGQRKYAAAMHPISSRFGETKAYAAGFEAYTAVAGTPALEKTREEQDRIYNQQLSQLHQVEAEHLRFVHPKSDDVPVLRSSVVPTKVESKAFADHAQVVKETPEVLAAKEEHFRLYNAAKERSEKSHAQPTILGDAQDSIVVANPLISQELKSQAPLPLPVEFTDEVKLAREEHLKIVKEANLRAEKASETHIHPAAENAPSQAIKEAPTAAAGLIAGVQQTSSSSSAYRAVTDTKPIDHQPIGDTVGLKSSAPVQQAGQVQYTPEVARARAEHFEHVNAAKQQQLTSGVSGGVHGIQQFSQSGAHAGGAPAAYKAISDTKPTEHHQVSGVAEVATTGQYQQPEQIQYTPEVARARAEHFKQFNAVQQQQTSGVSGGAPEVQPSYHSGAHPDSPTAAYRAVSDTKPIDHIDATVGLSSSAAVHQSGQVQYTPEVAHARAEHFKHVDAVQQKHIGVSGSAHGIQQSSHSGVHPDSPTAAFRTVSNIKPTEHHPVSGGAEVGTSGQYHQPEQVQYTPEVARARAEHFKQFNAVQQQHTGVSGSNSGAQQSHQSGIHPAGLQAAYRAVSDTKPIDNQQIGATVGSRSSTPVHQAGQVHYTPEVARARAEHFKQFNAIQQQQLASGGSAAAVLQQYYKSGAYPSTPAGGRALSDTKPTIQESFVGATALETSGQVQQPGQIGYTPAVATARAEHLKYVHAAEQLQSIVDEPEIEKVLESDRAREEKSYLEHEELVRLREEERVREADRLIEQKALLSEQRFMEIERQRLQAEELDRLKLERLATESQIKGSSGAQLETESIQDAQLREQYGQIAVQQQQQLKEIQQQQQQLIEQQKIFKDNPFLSSAVQPSKFADKAQLQLAGLNTLQFPADTRFINLQNPLIIRYTEDGRPIFYTENEKLPGFGGNIATVRGAADAAATYPSSHGQATASLAELEKATREHFRAHEIALEQLHEANLRDAGEPTDDCY